MAEDLQASIDALIARQLEPITIATRRLIDHRYGSKGGPPPGAGLTIDQVVDQVVAKRAPDGSWPTQEAVAESLDVTGRRLRQLGPWRLILAIAAERTDDSG